MVTILLPDGVEEFTGVTAMEVYGGKGLSHSSFLCWHRRDRNFPLSACWVVQELF